MIYVKCGDITSIDGCDSIVNAANGIGIMGKGVAGAIRDKGGVSIQQEARQIYYDRGKPFVAGEFYKTGSGSLSKNGVKNIYHAVTMERPGSYSSTHVIREVMPKILEDAIKDKVHSIAFPGLGTGIGGVSAQSAAFCMFEIALEYHDKVHIYFVDMNNDFINAIRKKAGLL